VCGALVSLENLGTILSQNHGFPQSDCGFPVYRCSVILKISSLIQGF
jgi:hypothetical protein